MGGDLGPRPRQPLALVEVQGYYYDALTRLAETLRKFCDGDSERSALAERLEQRAAGLKEQFNRDFWWPEEGTFVQALDANKEQVRAVTSNPGHCLWSGIVSSDKAGAVVRRMMQPDMLSGWGVRTMSMLEPSYNPMSYHNGSVWPHDNALLIMGLRRYGFLQEMLEVAQQLFAAAGTYPEGRLPELYCGFARGSGDSQEAAPAAYPVSCSPRAWAAGAPALVLQALLGAEVDARQGTLTLDPALPWEMRTVLVEGLRVGRSRLSFAVSNEGVGGRYDISTRDGSASTGKGAQVALRSANGSAGS